jgi:hypothetical protein
LVPQLGVQFKDFRFAVSYYAIFGAGAGSVGYSMRTDDISGELSAPEVEPGSLNYLLFELGYRFGGGVREPEIPPASATGQPAETTSGEAPAKETSGPRFFSD